MSASARFRGLFGLPGHFPCPLPAAPVSWPGSSPSSSSRRGPCRAWGFQGPLVVLVWGLRFRGAPRQCCARSHVSGKPPTPHSGQAVLVTTSLREAGWVVTAAPPASVVCRLHVDFCHYRALLNSAAWLHQRSSTFPLEARIGFAWRFGDEVRAATGRRRSATIVSTHNLAAEAVCAERFVRAFVRASRPGGFEYPAGARGYDHCDSVSGCAGLSGVRESALFRPARGLAPRWRAAGVPTPATTA